MERNRSFILPSEKDFPIGVPSDTYTDLTPVVNHGLLVTAPAAGYVYIYGNGTGQAVLALISSKNSQSTYPSSKSDTKLFVYDYRPNGGEMAAVLPVKKGDNVWQDTMNFQTYVCRFVYAETDKRIIKY